MNKGLFASTAQWISEAIYQGLTTRNQVMKAADLCQEPSLTILSCRSS